jgi:hypothetical protein
MRIRQLLLPSLVAVVASCSGSNPKDLSTLTFAVAGTDFSGNSVQVCGSRPAADPKYACDSGHLIASALCPSS